MNNTDKCYADQIFRDYAEKISVYLPKTKSKHASYDKFRDVGYTITDQNYETVKAIVRDAKPEELILKNIGNVSIGAKKIVVKDNDVSLIKLSNRITIKSIEYYIYNDAVGNKFQLLGSQLGYSTIMIFRKEI
ncbi:MAG: hypothetical protein M0R03_12420 [Novosphingobium sp.]|nr:hypothetical protein [Novosphingobium sp.]